MPTVTFVNEKRSIEVPQGANLRKEALKQGIELYPGPHKYLNCLGNGMCCSCRVKVEGGEENLSPPGFWERLNMKINPLAFFAQLGSSKPLRLSCQTRVNGDCSVEARPAINWHGEAKFWE
jgi:ferredoxin